jgi:hypothetical protein
MSTFYTNSRGCTGELAKFSNSSVAHETLGSALDNMCVVVDLKFEQKIPSGSASSSSKTR